MHKHPPTVKQLETILQSVADGITVLNSKGDFVYVNQAAAGLMGFRTPEEVLAMSSGEIMARYELLNENFQPMEYSELPGRRAMQGEEEPVKVVGFKMIHSSQLRWSSVKAKPIYGKDGKIEFAVSVFQDITKLKNTELRLKEANKRITKLLESVLDND